MFKLANSLSRKEISDRLVVILGGLILLLIVIASWLPRECPLLKKELSGCPLTLRNAPLTAGEQEINRIGHQDMSTQKVFFNVSAALSKNRARVHFYYLYPDGKATVYLQLKENGIFTDVALVTSPLTQRLSWQDTSDGSLNLYQKVNHYSSIAEFLNNIPPKNSILVDAAAANYTKLQIDQYTPLSESSDLSGVDYFLTTYKSPDKDGSWNEYSYTIDASQADKGQDQKISWALDFSQAASPLNPFRLSTVDVDYIQ